MDEKLDVTPTLTLEPLENDTEVALQPATSAQPEAPVFDESSLSEQERKIVNDFAEKIELSNSNVILQYGSGAQKKIADLIGVSQATVSRMLREERDKRTKKEEERCQGKNSR